MGASSDAGFTGEAEPAWLDDVGDHYGNPVSVVGSEALSGGYVSSDVRRYELLCAGRPVSVVWKRATAREAAALRAVDETPGIGGPWLLAHGVDRSVADGSVARGSWARGAAADGSGARGAAADGSGACGAAADGSGACGAAADGSGARGSGARGSAAHGSGTGTGGASRVGGSAEPVWVLMPHHAGTPLVDGQPVPDAAYEILARVHARYLGARIPGVPVVDAGFWSWLCLDVALPAVRGAAQRAVAQGTGGDSGPAREVYRDAEAKLLEWADDERMLTALSMLPATLAHGDLHRGNILEGPDDAVIIDWGGARMAPGGLDLAVLAEQGGVDHERYHRRLAELRGRPVAPALVEVEQQWALAMGYVQYLGFAADCLGADRVSVMVDRAARAFEQLGVALARI